FIPQKLRGGFHIAIIFLQSFFTIQWPSPRAFTEFFHHLSSDFHQGLLLILIFFITKAQITVTQFCQGRLPQVGFIVIFFIVFVGGIAIGVAVTIFALITIGFTERLAFQGSISNRSR